MLDKNYCLKRIAEHRTDEIVITTMSVARPWADFSDSDFDLASVGSAMGHAADFGLGLALARPDRKVIVLNGDGSMLMCLGTLVTAASAPAPNLAIIVIENGTYEVTGNQPLPGSAKINFAQIAQGAGLRHVFDVCQPNELDRALSFIFSEKPQSPVFAALKIAPGDEPAPTRGDHNAAEYLIPTLADSAHKLRDLLSSATPSNSPS